MGEKQGNDNPGYVMDPTLVKDSPNRKDIPAEKDPGKTRPLRQFKRTIIIEPSFALFYMFHISSYPIISQYLYFAIGEKYNLSDLMRAAGENGSASSGPCGSEGDTNSSLYLLQQQVQAETSTFNLYLDLASGIPGFFACIFYGTLVDRLGRKPGLIIPVIGVTIKCVTYILVQLAHLPLAVVYFAHIVEALTGGIGAFMTACYAFYADTVTPANMGRRLAISDVAFGFSLAVMDVFMGFAITHIGFLWPFVIVVSGHFINLFYTIFFVPETVDKSKHKQSVSPKFITESLKVLVRKRPKNGRPLLLLYVVTWIICAFGTFNRYTLLHLYKLNSPFCWSAALIGSYDGLQAVISNTVQVIAAIVLMKRIGEFNVVQISCASFICAYVLVALSTTDWMLFMVPVVGCFMGLQLPVMRAILSGLVSNEEQGAIFSVVSASDRLNNMAGSAFFNSVYAITIYTFKGTVFVIMAGFVFIAMVFLGIFRWIQKKEEKRPEKEVDTYSIHSLEAWNTKF